MLTEPKIQVKIPSHSADCFWRLGIASVEHPLSNGERFMDIHHSMSTEQLTYDSQGIPDTSQINNVPPKNTSILDISAEFVTENLCGSKSKESPLNTDTPLFSENSIIPSIPTECNTPQLANIVDKLSTNQDMEKIDVQLTAM